MELDRSWKSPEISLSPNKDAMQSNVKAMAYKMQSCVSSMSREYYLLPESTPLSQTTYTPIAAGPPVLISPSPHSYQPKHPKRRQHGQLRNRNKRREATPSPAPSFDPSTPLQQQETPQIRMSSPSTTKTGGRFSCELFGHSTVSKKEGAYSGVQEHRMEYKMGKSQQPEAGERERDRGLEAKGWGSWLCLGFEKSGPPP